jgi:hypothetical protein
MINVPERRRIAIGRVVSMTFGMAWASFAVYFAAACLATLLPDIGMYLWFGESYLWFVTLGIPSGGYDGSQSTSVNIATSILQAGVQFVIIRHVHAAMTGAPESFGASWRYLNNKALSGKRIQTALSVYLMFTLGLMVTSLLLVLPGFFFAVCYLLVTPVAIIEGCGFTDCFSRSRFLTSGNRWQVLGAAGLLMVLVLVLSLAVPLVLVDPVFDLLGPGQPGLWVLHGLSLIGPAVGTMCFGVLYYVLYRELTWVRDGVSTADLPEVFD